jgi:hypothetical protein
MIYAGIARLRIGINFIIPAIFSLQGESCRDISKVDAAAQLTVLILFHSLT